MTPFEQRVLERVRFLYGDDEAEVIVERICDLVRRYASLTKEKPDCLWTEQDAFLITYGDSILHEGERPLVMLQKFLSEYCCDLFTTIHILPFFPFSSDDGFSVIDYREVNPEFGTWDDVRAINNDFDLMIDLVINHASRESVWFMDFVNDQPPGRDFFIEQDKGTDVSMVVRPRNTPLLVPVHTRRGVRHVWATFSEDQIDLNFNNPSMLLEFIDIFLSYVAVGARFLRLDAIAYLWKSLGTSCIHLPQTHEVVKLMRDVLERVAPEVVLITETNVPVEENISYFGMGDEAHMVYQFGLPPMVLHALYRGNAAYLTSWAQQIPPLPPGCTYLNFTASHDGIGVRPVENLLPANEVEEMIDTVRRYGGFVTMKTNTDGTESPYEMNVSLFDALMGSRRGPDEWQITRFICSQIIMLSMRGIPAVYIHSLTATPNDLANVERTGRMRSINRTRWQLKDLETRLANSNTPNAEVFDTLSRLLQIRKQQPAFHPDAGQTVKSLNKALFIIKRVSLDREQIIYALCNVSAVNVELAVNDLLDEGEQVVADLMGDRSLNEAQDTLKMLPYQCVWLHVSHPHGSVDDAV
ncbi:sugar phosphorylase [Zooshikella marina]|uniref:sugar phosphorylase n=1 Tax=Zooshikella ganghwensis TaxID=202772 RepID=UPI001BB0365F|nr:sugar phosphorylase [Zooshikella ganghwensis]MBU2706690.1 sugar phosphorylase [Zooshikella ganghwensis]